MKMFVNFSLLFLGLISFISCQTRSCDDLPEYFSSNNDAIAKIKAANFKVRDSISNLGGDWLMNAVYYSCDGEKGYIIYTLKSGSESYNPDIPLSIWKAFKNSASKDTYYDENIHKKYPRKKLHVVDPQ